MSLLQMSIAGAIMILAVIVIRALAINRLLKKTFIALWGIVLLRLLVPFSFPSPFSVYSLVNNYIPATQGAVELGNANLFPAMPFVLPSAGDILQRQTAASISLYAIIWGIGMIVCALFFTISYFKCRREFRESLPIKNDYLTQWIAEQKLSRPIEIRKSSRISAPLTYGVLNPIILMPKNTKWDDTKQIEYILAHEFIHVRRFDSVTKLFLTAALCIHWFNPLVWAMYILSNRDIELSCDETVVRSFGDTSKSAYARTLISMEEKKSSLTPLCNHFSKNAIEERITAIMKTKRTTLFTLILACFIVVGTASAFGTSAIASNNEELSFTSNQANADLYSVYKSVGLTVNEQTGTDIFDEYEVFGLSYDNSQNDLFYNGERVRLFIDVCNSNDVIISEEFLGSTTSNWDANGTVDVYVVRDSQTDKNGDKKLTGLRIATQEEFDKATKSMGQTTRIVESAK